MPRSANSSELIMWSCRRRAPRAAQRVYYRNNLTDLIGRWSDLGREAFEQRGRVEVERLDSVADRGPLLAQEATLLPLQQQLAHAFLDDEADAAPRLRVLLELAVGARGRER